MLTLKFADTHNMVAFLSKPEESEGFEQIIDFLNANPINYALTVNPTIYTSCIKQFWDSVKKKTVNGEEQLQAVMDRKKMIITESTIRRSLKFEDEGGVDCLSNEVIFEQLTLMGAKTTARNEFSSTMASAIICLATNQNFNFSKYIFDNMVKNLESMNKFLIYPRVIDLENTKTTQAMEINSLNIRVKKLAKKKRSRTHGLKRLYKVGLSARVESLDEYEGLGDPEDASEQGRKIADLDADEEITLIDESAKDQGSVAPTVSTDELTLAQALVEIKTSKPKAKRIVMQESTAGRPPPPPAIISRPSPTAAAEKVFRRTPKTFPVSRSIQSTTHRRHAPPPLLAAAATIVAIAATVTAPSSPHHPFYTTPLPPYPPSSPLLPHHQRSSIVTTPLPTPLTPTVAASHEFTTTAGTTATAATFPAAAAAVVGSGWRIGHHRRDGACKTPDFLSIFHAWWLHRFYCEIFKVVIDLVMVKISNRGCLPPNHHRGGGWTTVQPPQPHLVVSGCDGDPPLVKLLLYYIFGYLLIFR
nr:hypothetical protein [Tanacetum cinerariifolium]